MARTRAEIKTLVESHTGRTKDTLENSTCDSALKVALTKHPFNDAISTPSDFTLTEDGTSVDISSASALQIVTARIVEADGSRNTQLIMKNRTWWDENVINPEDNTKGWPIYGLKAGSTVYFDRPLQDGLELRIRVTTEQTFAADATECPIALLDIFVEKYVTAEVFLDIGNHERYLWWRSAALGPQYDKGKVGGALFDAIQSDLYEIAEDVRVERSGEVRTAGGLAVLNLNTWHERYNQVDTWY
jgi:hypothetical protein